MAASDDDLHEEEILEEVEEALKHEDNPVVEPKVIRKLKNRDRLVDFGVRQEILEELDKILSDRRKPDRISDDIADVLTRRMRDATKPVARNRVKEQLDRFQ